MAYYLQDNISCSTHCAANCISRQPPGHDVVEDPPRKSAGRTYPVADPVDLQLNWQTIAVRHAWRKAAEMDDAGIDRIWNSQNPDRYLQLKQTRWMKSLEAMFGRYEAMLWAWVA
eukprot:symbB.v1.2.038221.t1/scaffold5879.1/size22818/3